MRNQERQRGGGFGQADGSLFFLHLKYIIMTVESLQKKEEERTGLARRRLRCGGWFSLFSALKIHINDC